MSHSQSTIPLRELASIIRSKNAGPFRITLDILFSDAQSFERVRASKAITKSTVAGAYGIGEDGISSIYEIDMARAFKVTLSRPIGQGNCGESDMYGCQQHVPLLTLPVTEVSEW